MSEKTRPGPDGVITVFFTLLSILFLGLIFVLIESARYQGARAQAANNTDMAHYSAFSEYEQLLLKEFEIFGVDASYGSGDFSIDRFRDRLLSYMNENASPTSAGLALLGFDPWKVRTGSCRISEYALLTDDNAEPFYQQVVTYMKKTAITQAAGTLLSVWDDAQEAKKDQEQFEKEKNTADSKQEELAQKEEEAQKKLEEAQNLQDESGEFQPEEAPEESFLEAVRRRRKLNPLPALKKLAGKDLLTITCGNVVISQNAVAGTDLTFSRWRKKGNLSLNRRQGGRLDDLYFKEYLLNHFHDYRSWKDTKLKYELEYILSGKRSDRENLKSTIQKLLLIREGCNYAFCAADVQMSSEAGALAEILMGWTGIPALVSILKHSLLLGWAYAESLLDVRELMEGGRIPLKGTKETWLLSIDQLVNINELLEHGRGSRKEGLDYHGYLRLLMYLQGCNAQKKRGLELIELRVRSQTGLSNFQADHLVVAVHDQTEWHIPPLFSRVTGVFMGLMSGEGEILVDGGFSYLQQ